MHGKPMDIIMVTPASPGSRAGNRATADRWQRLLEQSGHRVSVMTGYEGEPCDLMIALHAWRSHAAIKTFRRKWPELPLIVVLTGTDIYRYQHRDPAPTRESMTLADVLVGLHDLVGEDIAPEFHGKLVTLYQSAEAVPARPRDGQFAGFDVCVIGHLREEKDSLRAAMAARLLPPESRIRVLCAGKAHDSQWQQRARTEMAENSRFLWYGELGSEDTENLLAQSQLMVISSVMEGGANVVSEACRAGIPVIASDIPGNRGLLGQDYAGYYPVTDTQALVRLLVRAETDSRFLHTLTRQVRELASRFTPERERRSLEQVLDLARQRRQPRTVVSPSE